MKILSELLKDFKVDEHQPSLPSPQSTPKPERSKVIGKTDRAAINKQAALIISPMRSWIYQPLPEPKLPTIEQKEIDALHAELKVERNAHALSRDEVGNLRIQLKTLKETVERLTRKVKYLEQDATAKAETIRQLEDLRL